MTARGSLLCMLRLHRWQYIPNEHGGRPMRRVCACCPAEQQWNYTAARERGQIIWETVK